MRYFPKTISIPLLMAIALVAASATGPIPAHACDFEEPPPPERAFDEATAVFAGEVIEIEPVDDDPSDQYDTVTFAIDQAWKGVEWSPVTVETHQDEATCGYPFEVGERYLVYAYGGERELVTALFHRTTAWDNAGEDLDALGPGDTVESAAGSESEPAPDDGEAASAIVLILAIVLLSIATAAVILIQRRRPGFSKDEDDLG